MNNNIGVYRRTSLITAKVSNNIVTETSIEQFMRINGLGKMAPVLETYVSNNKPDINTTININVTYTDNDNKFLDEILEKLTISWHFTGDDVSVLESNDMSAMFTMNSLNKLTIVCTMTDAHGNASESVTILNECIIEEYVESGYVESGYVESGYVESGYVESGYVESQSVCDNV